jgi:hypothetical protein
MLAWLTVDQLATGPHLVRERTTDYFSRSFHPPVLPRATQLDAVFRSPECATLPLDQAGARIWHGRSPVVRSMNCALSVS